MATVDPHLLADQDRLPPDQDRVRGFSKRESKPFWTQFHRVSNGTSPPEPNFCWKELGEIDVTFSTGGTPLHLTRWKAGLVTFETYRFGDNGLTFERQPSQVSIETTWYSRGTIPSACQSSLLVDNRVDIINLCP